MIFWKCLFLQFFQNEKFIFSVPEHPLLPLSPIYFQNCINLGLEYIYECVLRSNFFNVSIWLDRSFYLHLLKIFTYLSTTKHLHLQQKLYKISFTKHINANEKLRLRGIHNLKVQRFHNFFWRKKNGSIIWFLKISSCLNKP